MQAIGIYLDDDEWKAAHLKSDKKKFQIQELVARDVKSFYTAWPQKKKPALISGLDAWEIFLRPLHLELKSLRQINAVLPFQIESLLPHPLEELLLFPVQNKKEKTGSQLSIFATKKALLLEHLEKLKNHDLDPIAVSCTATALFRFARRYFPDEPSLFVFHLGKKRSQCIAIEEGHLCYAHSHSLGISQLLEEAKKDLKNSDSLLTLDLTALNTKSLPNLSSLVAQWEKEIDRLLCFLAKKCPNISKIVITGDGDHFFRWRELFNKALPSHLTLLSLDASQDVGRYAIPIGLALDHLSQDRFSIQWRSGDSTHPSIAKKRRTHLLTYLGSSLLLTLFTWIAGLAFVHHKEAKIKEQLRSSLGSQMEGKDLSQAVEDWGNSLEKKKISFPFFLSAPKVSEVLAWLSTHPKLINTSEQFEVKNFRYNLIKCAHIGAKNEGYEAKVELEFTTNSPRLAREFHDALLAGDQIVNPKKEIKWQVQQNSYHTAFFLNSQLRQKGSSP